MHPLNPAALAIALVLGVSGAVAADEPSPGSPERAVLLEAARAPAEAVLGSSVRFRVHRLKRQDGWAFLLAEMQDARGAPVDYRGTALAEAAEQGAVSRDYAALLRWEDGAWTVTASAVGPTDVAWEPWPETHGAPAALFQP